jgi:mRNA-degrading endonuclease RelE of RelBE toxin-antitoxin system
MSDNTEILARLDKLESNIQDKISEAIARSMAAWTAKISELQDRCEEAEKNRPKPKKKQTSLRWKWWS